jgi:hypothetical protein
MSKKKLAYEATNATFGNTCWKWYKLNLALLSHHPLLEFG